MPPNAKLLNQIKSAESIIFRRRTGRARKPRVSGDNARVVVIANRVWDRRGSRAKHDGPSADQPLIDSVIQYDNS